MKMNRSVLGLLAIAGLAYAAGHLQLVPLGTSAWAQDSDAAQEKMLAYMELVSPDAHHQALEPLVGEWSGTFTMWMEPGAPPMTSVGTITRKWVLGGRFLKEVVEASSDIGTFQGLGYMGYNRTDGQYEFVWMESMSTAISFASGSLDPATNVLATRGTYREPVTGKLTYSRGEMDLSDPNRQVYIGYATGPDGKEYKSFEGVTVRK